MAARVEGESPTSSADQPISQDEQFLFCTFFLNKAPIRVLFRMAVHCGASSRAGSTKPVEEIASPLVSPILHELLFTILYINLYLINHILYFSVHRGDKRRDRGALF